MLVAWNSKFAVIAPPLRAIEPGSAGFILAGHRPNILTLFDHACHFVGVGHIQPAVGRKSQCRHTSWRLAASVNGTVGPHAGPNCNQLVLVSTGQLWSGSQSSGIIQPPAGSIPLLTAAPLAATSRDGKGTVIRVRWQERGQFRPVVLIATYPGEVDNGEQRRAGLGRIVSPIKRLTILGIKRTLLRLGRRGRGWRRGER